jgi:hypothetical protein
MSQRREHANQYYHSAAVLIVYCSLKPNLIEYSNILGVPNENFFQYMSVYVMYDEALLHVMIQVNAGKITHNQKVRITVLHAKRLL